MKRLSTCLFAGFSLYLAGCSSKAHPELDATSGVSQSPSSAEPELNPTSSDRSTDSTSASDSGASSTADINPCAQAPLSLASTPLRRLTPAQYNATVNALFAPTRIDAQPLQDSPETFGFTNFGAQQQPSALVIQQFQQGALRVSAQAMSEVERWSGCPSDGGPQASSCGERFLRQFIPRAFRRPQNEAALEPYLSHFRTQLAASNFQVALSLTIQALLQAPSFLYFIEESTPNDESKIEKIEKLDSFSLASRLSYFIWDNMPDQALWEAAQRGELSSPEQIASQARRMLADPKARPAMVRFFQQWLDAKRIDRISLDTATYPSYRPRFNAAFREALDRRIEHAIFDGPGTLASLLTQPQAWVNADLAPLYGVDNVTGNGWKLVDLPSDQRAGLLTDAGWLASRSHAVHPSPVARGVFVLERMLCRPSYPPPADTDTTPPQPDPNAPKTNRQRYEQHVLDPTCAGCHKPIDGIGMGFEHYDAFGRWREQDNGFPVDASGLLVGTKDRPFRGALELSQILSQDPEVQRCVSRQLFRYAMARDPKEPDQCNLEALDTRFIASQMNFIDQMVSIVSSPAFRYRRVGSTP